jgi:selenide, water dikinase
VTLSPDFPDWQRHLLTDPQTSGGLLVACAAVRADTITRSIRDAGYPAARVIGHAEHGGPGLRVFA